MPKLLRSSETLGCGATIELDNGEVVYLSIAQVGVLVRKWDMSGGFIKTTLSNFFGPKLYNESSVYKNAQTARALSLLYPEQAPLLSFQNPALAAFSNAIWHCGSAAEVCVVLNEAAAKVTPQDIEDAAHEVALQGAFDAAKNRPPKCKRPPEETLAPHQVIFSDGKVQEELLTPREIKSWATGSNRMWMEANKPYRIVRIVDPEGRVVWNGT